MYPAMTCGWPSLSGVPAIAGAGHRKGVAKIHSSVKYSCKHCYFPIAQEVVDFLNIHSAILTKFCLQNIILTIKINKNYMFKRKKWQYNTENTSNKIIGDEPEIALVRNRYFFR